MTKGILSTAPQVPYVEGGKMRKGMTEEKIFLAFLFLSPAVTPFPRHSSGILSVRKVRGLSRKRSKKKCGWKGPGDNTRSITLRPCLAWRVSKIILLFARMSIKETAREALNSKTCFLEQPIALRGREREGE